MNFTVLHSAFKHFTSVWANWLPWSSCSSSCGDFGTKTRNRECVNTQECSSLDKEVDSCWNGACKPDKVQNITRTE